MVLNKTYLNKVITFLTSFFLKKKKQKFKANTLPEVLIAIVIIVFTSALGIIIYLNIQQSTQPFIKLKANEIANAYLLKSETEHNYFDDNFKEEEFTIKKTVKRSELYPDCVILKIAVSSIQEKEICVIHKLLYAH